MTVDEIHTIGGSVCIAIILFFGGCVILSGKLEFQQQKLLAALLVLGGISAVTFSVVLHEKQKAMVKCATFSSEIMIGVGSAGLLLSLIAVSAQGIAKEGLSILYAFCLIMGILIPLATGIALLFMPRCGEDGKIYSIVA